MKIKSLLVIVFSVLLTPMAVYGANPDNGKGEGGRPAYVLDEVLVKYKAGEQGKGTPRYQNQQGFTLLHSFGSIGVDHLKLPKQMTVEEALAALQDDPAVEYAEPNYYRYDDADPIIPDDPYFGALWGLHNTINDADIDAPEAWSLRTASDDVVVAVVDSGLDYDHPDLAGNIWSNGDEIADNGIDDDNNGYIDDIRGWDFVNNDNAPFANDPRGHGTHVAGTIGARGNNATGVVGVTWSVQIMPLRFLNAFGMGDTADAILAIEYANANGADVINNSWGGAGYSQALKDVIDASPALVVCAAGNSAVDSDLSPHYPASYASANIISVAATDSNDDLAEFSNFGVVSVDVAAPGTDILSSVPGRQVVWRDDFDDGALDNWLTGGKKARRSGWDITGTESFSPVYSITINPGTDYLNNANNWIKPPALDLSEQNGTRLDFMIKGTSQVLRDQLYVETSLDDVNWTAMAVKLSGVGYFVAVSGTIEEWTLATVDLEPYDGIGAVYFRFLFTSDRSITDQGYHIDDVEVSAASSDYDGSEYKAMSGTSMAAPHVAGIAALVKAGNPALSAVAVKEVIEENVDPLGMQTATGGRVNAHGALFNTPPPEE